MTVRLNIHFENCYGIRKLEHNFEFSIEHSIFSIYAPNGSMKTSFAKTFEDKSNGDEPKDLIFPKRQTICDIKLGNEDIKANEIFVINSYVQDYKSDKLSTLLVNKELKNEYEQVHKDINEKKKILLEGLKAICNVRKVEDIEEKISKVFYQNEGNKFFEAIERIKAEINSDEITQYLNVKYEDVFNAKVENLLQNPDIQNDINEYIKKYDELLDRSTYFKRGIFNHSQAEDTAKQLTKNGFFKAEHSVLFGDKTLSTEKELAKVIEDEKNKILADSQLKQLFNSLDTKINKNQDVRNFREFLSNNSFIISELSNLESFKSKLWKYYLKENETAFNDLLSLYDESKVKIKNITEQAQREKTSWLKVIDIFNDRFTVPFELTIANQIEAMLKNAIPAVTFKFVEQDDREDINKEKLLQVLSQGEKRALYLLNIIFEVEARKKVDGIHLFIIDDIADSFDYKNKYAIIEYLRDISKTNSFYQIILSHNFDFHRTVSNRLSVCRKNKLNILKSDRLTEFTQETYQNNPFTHWRKNLAEKYFLIASIAFVRNLSEYSGDEHTTNELTAFFHMKKNTNNLTVGDLKELFGSILKSDDLGKIIKTNRNYIDLLNEASTKIINKKLFKLEHKIVLSIAIRLKAEQFIIDKIRNDFVSGINGNQTAILIDKYKSDFSTDTNGIKVLDNVQLMTPENIHLNSFMYEPLLDMSHEHLVKLYKKVEKLLK